MATVVSQHVRHIGRHLELFKIFILRKIAANFTESSRKHVFPANLVPRLFSPREKDPGLVWV